MEWNRCAFIFLLNWFSRKKKEDGICFTALDAKHVLVHAFLKSVAARLLSGRR
jgi:hypothetical protein